jgi:SAM-dependent methyltransferase
VAFREGDLLKDDFGSEIDVVLLCNILHHFPASTNAETLGRMRRAMKKDGVVGIFDIEPPEASAPPEAAADAFALLFRITSTSTCFRGRDYVDWLQAAGFRDAQVVRSVKMPSRILVHARA